MDKEKIKERAREYMRQRRQDPGFREREHRYFQKWYAENGRGGAGNYMEAILEWQAEHPERVKVNGLLNSAVKSGMVSRPRFCQQCGRGGFKMWFLRICRASGM